MSAQVGELKRVDEAHLQVARGDDYTRHVIDLMVGGDFSPLAQDSMRGEVAEHISLLLGGIPFSDAEEMSRHLENEALFEREA